MSLPGPEEAVPVLEDDQEDSEPLELGPEEVPCDCTDVSVEASELEVERSPSGEVLPDGESRDEVPLREGVEPPAWALREARAGDERNEETREVPPTAPPRNEVERRERADLPGAPSER